MITQLLAMAPLMLAGLTAAAAPPVAPVEIADGLVQGVADGRTDTVAYKGIPFAAPPIGALRWAPPQPPARWTGVRQADHFGADCPQPVSPAHPSTLERLDEDCLYLNLWAPAAKSAEKYPVLVWIYGGSFIGGGTSDPHFDGAKLAARGVVLVTVNYRTGALGYLAHPALSKASPSGASGNYGVMDNIAALRWVRANIAAFGGDPARVTVFGQSAGAVSVNMLLAAPSAKGLLAGGIVQSGPLFGLTPAMRERPVAEAFGERFMAARGATTVAEMRALPWEKLQVLNPEEQKALLLPFAPIADGDVLPLTATHAFQQHREDPLPLIIGSTAQENSSSVPAHFTPADFEQWVRATYGDKADAILPLWPHADDTEARTSRVTLRSYAINEGSLYEARLHAQVQPKTWLYRFDRVAPSPDAALYGADHGSDVAYTFDDLTPGKRQWTDVDREVSVDLITYWINFARTGNPNGKGVSHWPAVTEAATPILHFGDERRVEPVADIARLGMARRAEDVKASVPMEKAK